MTELDHSILAEWIEEVLDALDRKHPNLTSTTEARLVSNTTVVTVWAHRGSSDKWIGAIGYKKLFEKEATSATVFAHTISDLTPRIPTTASAYIMVPILNLHQGFWETKYYMYNHGNLQEYTGVATRNGTTKEQAVKSEIDAVLELNLAGLSPDPVVIQYGAWMLHPTAQPPRYYRTDTYSDGSTQIVWQ